MSRLDELDLGELNRILAELEQDGRRIVEAAGVAAQDISARLNIDMRYVGQGYEVRVPFAMDELQQRHIAEMRRVFEAEYRAFYGQLADGVPIEAVNWRILISGPQPRVDAAEFGEARTASDSPVARRHVRFAPDQAPMETPVFRRERLSASWSAEGPCIIEEEASTTVVAPGWSVAVAASGCLLLTREDAQA